MVVHRVKISTHLLNVAPPAVMPVQCVNGPMFLVEASQLVNDRPNKQVIAPFQHGITCYGGDKGDREICVFNTGVLPSYAGHCDNELLVCFLEQE